MMLFPFLGATAWSSLHTTPVRWAVRALGAGVLFCVLLGAVASAAEILPAPESTAAPAEAETGEAVEADPIATLTAKASEVWKHGDVAGAERLWADALSLDVPLAHKRALLLTMADHYETQPDHLKAIAVLERFLKAFPEDRELPEVLMRVGLLYRETGAYGTATARFFAVLNSTLRITQEDFVPTRRLAMKARLEIADTYMLQGKAEEARQFYSRLQLLDLEAGDRERVQFRGAQLQHALRDWLPAERELGAFLDSYPESRFAAEARYLRARALKELGRRDEAVQEVLTLLRSQELSGVEGTETTGYWKRRTGNELANNFYEQGDFLGALAIYQALARASEDPAWRWPAVYQVGLCFERLHLPQRAAEAYQVIVGPEATAGGRTPLPEALVSLQSMARWRLGHLDWIEDFEKRLQVLTSGQTADA